MTIELARHDVAWAVRRLPKAVRDLLRKHGPNLFLAGGYVRATIASEHVNDIDLFCSSKEFALACAQELAGPDGKVHETDNAYTVATRPWTQFIHRWTFDGPISALESFDFTIAQAAVWWAPGLEGLCPPRWMGHCSEHFYPDLAGRRLVYTSPTRIEEVGGSMLRVLKFYQRGYRIPLDSLGAVIARLVQGVKWTQGVDTEERLAFVLTGLLREVDPAIDPDHVAHLPSSDAPDEEPANGAQA